MAHRRCPTALPATPTVPSCPIWPRCSTRWSRAGWEPRRRRESGWWATRAAAASPCSRRRRDRRVRSLVTWAAIADVVRWDERQRAEWRARGHLDVINTRTGQIIPLATDVLDEIEGRPAELDLERAARRIEVPWLIVHGASDESVAAAEAVALNEASGRASTTLVSVPGAGHTFGAGHPWAPPDDAPIHRVIDLTVQWLATSLG